MARYIDADGFFQTLAIYEKAFDDNRDFSARQTILQIMHELNHTPTADVEEVKHGEWIGVADYGNGNCIGYCSVCGTTHKAENASELKCFQRYCKWCGAKMDGGKAE